MRFHLVRSMGFVLACASSMLLLADDGEQKETKVTTNRIKSFAFASKQAAGKFYIGIHPSPVDDVLKAQLGIEVGLVVETVLPDSPAAKAGIQVHDILLKFGATELKTIANLQEAVEQNKDQEINIKYLRKASERSTNITPTTRPEGLVLGVPAVGDGHGFAEVLTEGANDPSIFILRMMPGVFELGDGPKPFPKNLSVQVNKDGDKPARVTVKYNGKSWEFNSDEESKLKELPPEIQEAVSALVHGGRGKVMIHSDGSGKLPHRLPPGASGAHSFDLRFDFDDSDAGAMQKKIDEALKKLPTEHAARVREHIYRSLKELGQAKQAKEEAKEKIGDTSKEIRELREAVEQLKKEIRERTK